MSYRYEFDDTRDGDLRLRRTSYELLQDAYCGPFCGIAFKFERESGVRPCGWTIWRFNFPPSGAFCKEVP